MVEPAGSKPLEIQEVPLQEEPAGPHTTPSEATVELRELMIEPPTPEPTRSPDREAQTGGRHMRRDGPTSHKVQPHSMLEDSESGICRAAVLCWLKLQIYPDEDG